MYQALLSLREVYERLERPEFVTYSFNVGRDKRNAAASLWTRMLAKDGTQRGTSIRLPFLCVADAHSANRSVRGSAMNPSVSSGNAR
jgi:hypothetical protein